MEKLKLVETTQMKSDLPSFHPGDTVNVHVRVVEGDKERIQRNVKWLLDTRRPGGWSYNAKAFTPDNSNTQYALLGLHEAHVAGFKIDDKTLKELRLASFNARVETVSTKPFFREPFKNKGCQ